MKSLIKIMILLVTCMVLVTNYISSTHNFISFLITNSYAEDSEDDPPYPSIYNPGMFDIYTSKWVTLFELVFTERTLHGTNGNYSAFCQDDSFTIPKNGSTFIIEWGNAIVKEDSVIITIIESDLPERCGITFTSYYSFDKYNHTVTFTNARLLTFGYVNNEMVTLSTEARVHVSEKT